MYKKRYALQVQGIGEYFFNASPEGLKQLEERIKPEFKYRIFSNHGIIANATCM